MSRVPDGLDFDKPYRMTIVNLSNGAETTEIGTLTSLLDPLKLVLANPNEVIDLQVTFRQMMQGPSYFPRRQ